VRKAARISAAACWVAAGPSSAAHHLRQQPAAWRCEEERRVGEAVVVGVLDLVAEAGRRHRREQLAVAVDEEVAVVRLGMVALQQQEGPGQRAVRQVAIRRAVDVGGGHDARVFAHRRDRSRAAEGVTDRGDLRGVDPAALQRRRQRQSGCASWSMTKRTSATLTTC
jgi:hypothetical protein